ncbi:hypothetical protein CW829_14785 [Listeria monocytogenes]|nr:hypothetical protein [Listeria monocytogenes]
MKKSQIENLGKEILSIEAMDVILQKNECTFSFVAGSLVEGFGNEKSDIDIFVVCQTLPQEESIESFRKLYPNSNVFYNPEKVTLTFEFKNIDFDIEFHLISVLNKAISKNNIGELRITDSYFDVLHRFKWSEPILKEQNYLKVKKSINYDLFAESYIRFLSIAYSIKTTDIMGAYRAKNFQSAFFMAWFLLESCMDAYLSMYGETNPNNKWRVNKIKRVEAQPNYNGLILSEVLRSSFLNLDLNDDATLEIRIKEILKQCQSINHSIQKGRG